MSYHQHSLFCSDTVCIDSFDCSGQTCKPEKTQEEYTSNHEIVLMRSGAFLRYSAFGRVLSDVSHLLFFNRNHPYEVSHPIPGRDSGIIISLADSQLIDALQVFDPSILDRSDSPFQHGDIRLSPEQILAKYQLLSALDYANQSDSLEIEETLTLFLGWIFTGLQSRSSKQAMHDKTLLDAVQAVLQFLNQHYTEALSLNSISSEVHYSPFALCRMFKQVVGLSIHQYLSRLRLFYALEYLLEDKSRPVGDIGILLGFYSHSHFTSAFSRSYGMTPSTFREQISTIRLAQLHKNLIACRNPLPLD
jgi:AraC-like DNA-binding protein